MDDELLVRHLLDDLPAADRAAADARLAADPALAARLGRLRELVAGLRAAAPPAPPPGLAAAAVARTAEYLVASGLFRAEIEPEVELARPRGGRAAAALGRWVADPVFLGWRRADVAVAFTLGLLAAGLGLGAVAKLRQDSQIRGCQDNLRGLHAALAGYGDTHAGRYPQVGTPAVPVAGAFAAELTRAGQLWEPEAAACPVLADPDPAAATGTAGGYAYTLGYRGPAGQLVGVRQPDGSDQTTDWTPVAADPPGRPHPRGQNVLYAGGAVRLAATAAAGVNGDDIYANDIGLVRAGLHRLDAALGTGTDIP